MKRILFAITGLGGGGAERVVSVWASQLAEKGYDVGVFTFAKGKNEYPLNSKVKRLTITDNIKDYLAMGYFKRYRLMRKIIKTFEPNVVIGFLQRMQVWMAAVTIGLKIKRIDTVRISPWHASVGKFTKMLWKMCFKTGDLTILQSEDQKPFFSKKVQKKCVVVPNPLNEAYENERKIEFSSKITKFVSAGRLCKQKNFPLLIKAFAKACENNNDISLDIFGKGDEKYTLELQQLIDELNMKDRITLCGRTDDMHKELMKRDAFIMSSNYEGMPNALAEAMAVGLTCISTDCKTGPRDLIKDGENGYLVPVGDEEKLAEKIQLVASLSPDRIKELGTLARGFVTELCGRENSLQKLIEAIEK